MYETSKNGRGIRRILCGHRLTPPPFEEIGKGEGKNDRICKYEAIQTG